MAGPSGEPERLRPSNQPDRSGRLPYDSSMSATAVTEIA